MRAISAVECNHILTATHRATRNILALVYDASAKMLSCYKHGNDQRSLSDGIRINLRVMANALDIAIESATNVLKSVFKDYDERLYRKQDTEALYRTWSDIYRIVEKLKRYRTMTTRLLSLTENPASTHL